jgi:hypothetical protein
MRGVTRSGVWATVFVAACGRIGFDPLPGTAATFTHSMLTFAPPNASLGDIVVPVILDDTRAARQLIGDGSDLRFLDAGVPLPYEIEQLGAPGGPPLIAWVRLPSLAVTGATIEVAYGGNTGPAATSAVWQPPFVGVWHFAGAGVAADSTQNHLDAQPSGSSQVAGVFGNGRSFAASATDHLTIADSHVLAPSGQTLSGWVRLRTSPSGFYGMVTRQYGIGGDNDVYLGVEGGMAVTTCEAAGVEYDAVGSAVAVGTWTYLTGVADAGDEQIFVDGVTTGVIATGQALTPSNLPLFIGADRSNNSGATTTPCCDYLDGDLDELRVQDARRPPEWIAYDYRAQLDQVITYGPIVTGP